jgi:uncharacterized radical SAM superfamily Fe-S cluster-containing enzyme
MNSCGCEKEWAGRMISASLQDKFGRTIKDLRISVTNRCNFRCFCCIRDGDEHL